MANVHFYVTISGVPLSGFGEMDLLRPLNSPKYIHHPQKHPTITWETSKLKQHNSPSPSLTEMWL